MGGSSSGKTQLGRIWLQQKAVSAESVDDVLPGREGTPGKVAAAAEASPDAAEGDAPELRALSEQYGVPGVDLTQWVVPLTHLDLIPAEIARKHKILPIVVKDEQLVLAMADPSERRVIEEVEFVTGRSVSPYVARSQELAEVVETTYAMHERGEPYFVGPNAPSDVLQQYGLAPNDGAGAQAGAQAGVAQNAPGTVVPGSQEDDTTEGAELQLDVDFDFDAPSELRSREEPGSGAEPLPGASESPGGEPIKPQRREQSLVLVVDDEDDIRRLLRRVLEEKGYQVEGASQGLEALKSVRDHVPDVLVLDAMLPEIHGFEICRRIKGSKRYGHIPVIMVSAVYRGWRVAEDLRQSYGVQAFLEKPFKVADVLSEVEAAVQGTGGTEPAGDDETSDEAQTALDNAMAAYRQGDVDAAIEKLHEGLGVDPLSFQLHYHLGLLYGRREQLFDAIQELETGVDLQPKNFSALKNLAVLYQRTGFKHKAIEMWERALGTAPDDDTKQGIKDHLMSLL